MVDFVTLSRTGDIVNLYEAVKLGAAADGGEVDGQVPAPGFSA